MDIPEPKNPKCSDDRQVDLKESEIAKVEKSQGETVDYDIKSTEELPKEAKAIATSQPILKWIVPLKHSIRASCYDPIRDVIWLRTDCTCT